MRAREKRVHREKNKFSVQCSRFSFQDSECRVQGPGCRVEGLGYLGGAVVHLEAEAVVVALLVLQVPIQLRVLLGRPQLEHLRKSEGLGFRVHGLGRREARAVPSAFVGEGAALCYAKGIPAATGGETVGSWSQ